MWLANTAPAAGGQPEHVREQVSRRRTRELTPCLSPAWHECMVSECMISAFPCRLGRDVQSVSILKPRAIAQHSSLRQRLASSTLPAVCQLTHRRFPTSSTRLHSIIRFCCRRRKQPPARAARRRLGHHPPPAGAAPLRRQSAVACGGTAAARRQSARASARASRPGGPPRPRAAATAGSRPA
jgi:hypothetical protein